MKKIVSIMSAAAMLASAAAPAFAVDNTEAESILRTVKERLALSTDEYKDLNSSSYDNGKHTEYTFTWSDTTHGTTLSVTCNDIGIITDFNKQKNDDHSFNIGAHIPQIDAASAKTSAEEFAAKLNPDIKNDLTISESSGSSLYNEYVFTVERTVGGYPISGNTGYMEVDAQTGEVKRYTLDYRDVSAPSDPSKLISEDDAKTAFKEQLGMELVYASYHDKNSIIYYPVYTLKDNSKHINAQTGKAESISLYRNGINEATMDSAASGGSGKNSDTGLSEAEISELQKISGLISKDEIEKSLRSNSVLNIGSDAILDSCTLYRDYNDKNKYTYSLSFTDSEGHTYIYASVSANDGTVINYTDFSASYATIDSDLWDRSMPERDTAFEQKAVDELAADKLNEYKYDESSKYYYRYVNDIRVEDQTISAEAYNGKLAYYHISYNNTAKFPELSDITVSDADAAADRLFDMTPYRIYCYEGADSTQYYYDLGDSYNISPVTGKFVNYKNEEIQDEQSFVYTDISGHYAEAAIKELAEHNIGFEGSEFKPNSKITVGEFNELISTVINPISPLSAGSYLRSKGASVSDEFDENSILTRENAAILMVMALGADEYADYDIYITPFKDVTEYKGYIALLYGMGVVHGDADMFYPKNEMTRAEAAVMVYNYLNR